MRFVNPPRVVVFMSMRRAVDIPSTDNSLACLLTLGATTFAERVMDSCALAGFREIDIVLGDDSQCVREALSDGSNWGIKLNWYDSQDQAAPYAVLQSLHLRDGQRLLIGHGHQWVSDRILFALMKECDVAMHVAKVVSWTGWFGLEKAAVPLINPLTDYASLGQLAAATSAERCIIARHSEFANPVNALSLLQAQNLALHDMTGDGVPQSWLRMSWGAMSPDAIIHPQATMIGPVLIGRGCLIARNARVGPGAVLGPNVLIAEGAVVRGSLVLANTYVDGRSVLEHSLARGNTVQVFKWTLGQPVADDGALLPARATQSTIAVFASQLLAAWVAVMLLPGFLLLLVWNCLNAQPWLWQSIRAVNFKGVGTEQLYFSNIRQPHFSSLRSVWLVGCYGALLDVIQGRRSWFGMRPRTEAQWARLGQDWQNLFVSMGPGFFHAPSSGEKNVPLDKETQAAADAFLAAQSSFKRRLSIFKKSVRQALMHLNYGI